MRLSHPKTGLNPQSGWPNRQEDRLLLLAARSTLVASRGAFHYGNTQLSKVLAPFRGKGTPDSSFRSERRWEVGSIAKPEARSKSLKPNRVLAPAFLGQALIIGLSGLDRTLLLHYMLK